MAPFAGDFYKPELGSTPAQAPQPSVSPAYPPNVGLSPVKQVQTYGAALEYAVKTYGGTLNELESNPLMTIAPGILVEGNGDRIALVMVNLGTNDVFIGISPGVSTTNGIKLAAQGGFATLNVRDDVTLCPRRWWAVTSTLTSLCYVLELVRVTRNPVGI